MEFIYGVVGFMGFEALRIYKCMWGERPVVPLKHRHFYAFIVIAVGGFAGLMAVAFGSDNPVQAVYLGFSVPTSLKAMFERADGPSRGGGRDADHVEDIGNEAPTFVGYVRQQYLAFR